MIVDLISVQTFDTGVGAAFVERDLLRNLLQGRGQQLSFLFIHPVDSIEHKGLGTTVMSQYTERIQDALLYRLFLSVQAIVQTWGVVGVEHHTAIFVLI